MPIPPHRISLWEAAVPTGFCSMAMGHAAVSGKTGLEETAHKSGRPGFESRLIPAAGAQVTQAR